MKFTHIPFFSLRRKTPSLLFMLRKERNPFYSESDKTVFTEAYFVPQHIFILTKHLSKICFVFNFLCRQCNMMYDVMLQNDEDV
jgi:hypothetical protein